MWDEFKTMLTKDYHELQKQSDAARFTGFANIIQEETEAFEAITHLSRTNTEDLNTILKLNDFNSKLQYENSTLQSKLFGDI